MRYWCERALIGEVSGAVVADAVLVGEDGGVVTSVTAGAPPASGAVRLPGLTIPGLVNAHSHAFHRALRGRTQAKAGDFWSWRDQMYAVAERLEPDTYYALARAVYAEMALAGITAVGEFHYLHHAPGGAPYRDPNAMGHALLAAAAAAGIRITLLDACYLQGGFDRPLEGAQLRFGDGTAEAWAARAERLVIGPKARGGAAIHSVRAVDRGGIGFVAGWAGGRQMPLHVHVSEQPAENEQCMATFGCTPTRLLADGGALSAQSTVVHATHLERDDISAIGRSETLTCLCPTTERDLGDGVGPAVDLTAAGSALCVGSDSHAVVDLFEEARGIELHERLVTGHRGLHAPADLLAAATAGGSRSIGWPEAGCLAPGRLADFVTVSLAGPRLAGSAPDSLLGALVFAATAADVSDVVVAGQRIVANGRHCLVDDVPGQLSEALATIDGAAR